MKIYLQSSQKGFYNTEIIRFILVLTMSVFAPQIHAQWFELGGYNSLKANDYISSICKDSNNNIYAAGAFTNSKNKQYVAKFNGSTWSELGGINDSTFNGRISCVINDKNGNIYAAGFFKNSNNKNYVAKWNGTNWSQVGGNNNTFFNGNIDKLIFDKFGNLYAIGGFANNNNLQFVAKWNGNSWSEVGGSNNSTFDRISCIVPDDNGNIFISGLFKNSIGKYYVAKWNGTTWSEVGGSNSSYFNSYISTLAIDSIGNLYASGGFYNTNFKNYVAKWNGLNWSELGGNNKSNFSNLIYTLSINKLGEIYASGTFKNKNDVRFLAKFKDTSWIEIGAPQNIFSEAIVNHIAENDSTIYLAGFFTNALGRRYVAKYTQLCTPTYSDLSDTACGSFIWAAKGNKLYTQSNFSDTVIIKNVRGCDSIITLRLIVIPSNQITKKSINNTSICSSNLPYIWNGKSYNAATIDTAYFNTPYKCDSLAILNLTIKPTPLTANINGPTNTTRQDTASYSVISTIGSVYNWNVVGGNLLSANGTNQILVKWITSGIDTLKVTETFNNGCIGSTKILIINVSPSSNNYEIEANSKIEVFPNPITDFIRITINDDNVQLKGATIYDLLGKEIVNTSKSEIDLSEVKSGIYFLKIQDYTDNFYSKKLIKN